MALVSAGTSKTISDGAAVPDHPILLSLTITAISAKIATEAARVDERTYTASFVFDADINGKTQPVEIIQSDLSRVVLGDVIKALTDEGYRVTYKSRKASSVSGIDKVQLTVAWD